MMQSSWAQLVTKNAFLYCIFDWCHAWDGKNYAKKKNGKKQSREKSDCGPLSAITVDQFVIITA